MCVGEGAASPRRGLSLAARAESFSASACRFDLADQLVRLFLSHLSAAYHILNEVARTFDDESSETGGSVDDVFHRCGHFAAGFETYLMGFCRHLGDSVFDVGAAMTGASAWWNARGSWRSGCSGSGWRGWLGRFVVLSHRTLLLYGMRARVDRGDGSDRKGRERRVSI